MADDSEKIIQLAIWGDFASKFEIGNDEHPVIAFKRIQVSDFMGKSLNSNEDSQIIFDVPHPRNKILKSWYKHLADPSSL